MRRVGAIAIVLLAPVGSACGVLLGSSSDPPAGAADAADDGVGVSPGADGSSSLDAQVDADAGLADAAEEDARPILTECPGCTRYVFVLGETVTGNLGGVAGADERCRNEALDAGNGTIAGEGAYFKAWISDDAMSAPDRFQHHIAGPYVFAQSGRVVARDFNDFVFGTLASTFDLDPGAQAGSRTILTGTYADGGKAVGATCDNWSTTSAGEHPVAGSTDYSDGRWTSFDGGTNCFAGNSAHLYCVEDR